MIIFDIMKNAGLATLEEMMERQGPRGLGGTDFFRKMEGLEKEYKSGWIRVLRHFYQYALENQATNFATPWSEWAEAHGITQEPEVKLGDPYLGPQVWSVLP